MRESYSESFAMNDRDSFERDEEIRIQERKWLGEKLSEWLDKVCHQYNLEGYIPTNARLIEVDLDNLVKALKQGMHQNLHVYLHQHKSGDNQDNLNDE